MDIAKSMLLITSPWGEEDTFKLIPIIKECPYNEVIYDVKDKVLVIISKEKKGVFRNLSKLDENGDPMPLKRPKEGKFYKEERKLLEFFYEYYIRDKEEIKNFIQTFAFNTQSFNTDRYLIKEAA
jgi:hypothetical protein